MPPPSQKRCDYPGCSYGTPGENGEATPFFTSDSNTKKEEVIEELKNHVEMAHLLPIRLAEDRTKALENQAQLVQAEANKLREETAHLLATQSSVAGSDSGSTTPSVQQSSDNSAARPFIDKRDALPRPQIEENISSADWAFFKGQWDRYVHGSNMSSTQQVHHLWAACSQKLQRALHNGVPSTSLTPRY